MGLLRKYIIACVLCILMLNTSCISGIPSFHIREDIDFSFIKRVAVIPLENLTNEKFAGEIVRQVVISELLASGLVDVVVPGDVMSAINTLGIQPITSPDAKQIKALGDMLKVQAIVMGSVEEYGETRIGNISVPEVTITLMMADTGTGSIIWSVTKTRAEASFMAKHFGAKTKSMSETVLAVVREAIQTLVEY